MPVMPTCARAGLAARQKRRSRKPVPAILSKVCSWYFAFMTAQSCKPEAGRRDRLGTTERGDLNANRNDRSWTNGRQYGAETHPRRARVRGVRPQPGRGGGIGEGG